MRACVVFLWVLSCSSAERETPRHDQQEPQAGAPAAGGGSAATPDGGKPSSGGSAAKGGQTEPPASAGNEGSGAAGTSGSAPILPPEGGTSGVGGTGTAAGGDDTGTGGAAGDTANVAGAASGDGGAGASAVDPCDGARHWSAMEKWTDYAAGDTRVFGGNLWKVQTPRFCYTYPGHAGASGWLQVATCRSGAVEETAECQCAAGACCDGCYLRSPSYLCGEFTKTSQCLGAVVSGCGSAQKYLDQERRNLFCNGDSSACTRWADPPKYEDSTCPAGTGCVESGDSASCQPCN